MTRALSSAHPLILFCLDDAQDGLGDAWRTIWRLHLVSTFSAIFFFSQNFVRYFIWSVGTNPWKMCNYHVVYLQVADVNKYLDISLTPMKGEWRQGSD
jgi:hypothetical protein